MITCPAARSVFSRQASSEEDVEPYVRIQLPSSSLPGRVSDVQCHVHFYLFAEVEQHIWSYTVGPRLRTSEGPPALSLDAHLDERAECDLRLGEPVRIRARGLYFEVSPCPEVAGVECWSDRDCWFGWSEVHGSHELQAQTTQNLPIHSNLGYWGQTCDEIATRDEHRLEGQDLRQCAFCVHDHSDSGSVDEWLGLC